VNDGCPFCTIAPARIFLQNQHAISIADGFPISKGHSLVIPTRHAPSLYDLSEQEQDDLWRLVRTVRARLVELQHPDGFNIGVNDGEAAGQTVGHAHIHIIPRYQGDAADPRGGIRWIIPDKARYW
jgi:diadenosine tetraphosphate (Ap4A) HIT family hydrolase